MLINKISKLSTIVDFQETINNNIFFLPYLSSIHEKANCISIFWTERITHKGGSVPLMVCPRTQQANLPTCSPQPPLNAELQAGKLWIPFFKVFWYDSTWGMNPRSTNCQANALTTTSSRRPDNINEPIPLITQIRASVLGRLESVTGDSSQ